MGVSDKTTLTKTRFKVGVSDKTSISIRFQIQKRLPTGSLFQIGTSYYQPVFSANALPISARERTVLTPAASNAANLSSAVPLPPEMIAPA